jgi:6-phosphofructo-2-kinase
LLLVFLFLGFVSVGGLMGKYVGWNAADAVKDYISRINAKIPVFEPLTEEDFTYIKMINVNQRIEVRNTKGNFHP